MIANHVIVRRVVSLAKALLADTRGDSYASAEESWSRGAKVVLGAAVATGVGYGATKLANNTNHTASTLSNKISVQAGGGDQGEAQQMQNPW